MNVAVESDFHAGVTKKLADSFDVDSAANALCSKSMSKNVKVFVGYTSGFQKILVSFPISSRFDEIIGAGQKIILKIAVSFKLH